MEGALCFVEITVRTSQRNEHHVQSVARWSSDSNSKQRINCRNKRSYFRGGLPSGCGRFSRERVDNRYLRRQDFKLCRQVFH